MSTIQNTLLIPHFGDLWAWVRVHRSLLGYHVTSTTWVVVPGHLHEQLHKADIFIQGFNVLHFFFSERKVKDLKQQKEKTGHCDDGSSLEPGSEDSEGAPQVGLSVGEPTPLKLCMWGTAEPRMGGQLGLLLWPLSWRQLCLGSLRLTEQCAFKTPIVPCVKNSYFFT